MQQYLHDPNIIGIKDAIYLISIRANQAFQTTRISDMTR